MSKTDAITVAAVVICLWSLASFVTRFALENDRPPSCWSEPSLLLTHRRVVVVGERPLLCGQTTEFGKAGPYRCVPMEEEPCPTN